MSGVRGAVQAKWIVGKVIGTSMTKTAKVRVTRMVLDNYLLKVNMCIFFLFVFTLSPDVVCWDVFCVHCKY